MNQVAHYVWPEETLIGRGAAQKVGSAAKRLGLERVFALTDPGVMAAGLLEPILAALARANVTTIVHDKVKPNPDSDLVHACAQAFADSKAQGVIAVGGGSTLDTAKAVRLLAASPPEARIDEYASSLGERRRPPPKPNDVPPMIAIPTTSGTGSEVTPWAVVTSYAKQAKFGVGGAYLIPTLALCDPELTRSLPPRLTAATGLDALSHLIEAYVSTRRNPLLDPLILRGVSLVGRYLRTAAGNGEDIQARQAMLEAAMLGGMAISSNWLGACHSLAHQLSSFAGLHHGEAIALMLPVQMRFSLPGAPERYAELGQALEPQRQPGDTLTERARHAISAVARLIAELGLPTSLQDVDIDQDLIPAMAQSAYANDTNWLTNPRTITQEVMAHLYELAYCRYEPE